MKRELTEIQTFNLNLLLMLAEYARKDRLSASCLFGLSAEETTLVAALTSSHILTLASHIDECLFRPRNEFAHLISQSPQLVSVMSMALRP
ncbi:MAG: flagellar transcriptional regulator FlhD [Azoarcus sp.]|jgi:hypothetical protein|nr:flagellar transcriptional regulator FlhD [Azoarcus sp.]